MPRSARGPFRRETAPIGHVPSFGDGWIWPHWLDRQLDPGAPEFVPRGDSVELHNVTGRNWTTVGNVDSSSQSVVDPRAGRPVG